MTGGLARILKTGDIPFAEHAPTAPLSTFRIGGTCRYLISPRCQGELLYAVAAIREAGLPYLIVGRGSNLLFEDGEMSCAVLQTAAVNAVKNVGRGEFVADCGASLAGLARLTARQGFADLTFAAGIPGTVGGGTLMNAGAHGKSLGESVRSVTVLEIDTNKITTYFNEQLAFSYRNSKLQADKCLILRVTLCCGIHADPASVLAERRALLARRAATQPLDLPSAGSAFRRPRADVPLAKIFDEIGLKGLAVGGAMVSAKHAGFIVNTGGATARDVRALIAKIQDITEAERGFRPEPEIHFASERVRI